MFPFPGHSHKLALEGFKVQTDSMCGVHDRSDDRVTPRYLKVSTCSNGTSSRSIVGILVCFLFRDTLINLHLEGFKMICAYPGT